MTWASLMSVSSIFQWPHKWNTGSFDPGMASLLAKVNSHADLNMLIIFPLLHLSQKKKIKKFLVSVNGSPNLNINFFSLCIDIAFG